MAGFVVKIIYEGGKRALPYVVGGAKLSVRGAPIIFRPAAQFARAAVTGTPKYIQLTPQGARTTTITPFVRAGLQTRQVGAYVFKAAVLKGPVTAARVVRYAARTAARDVAYPYYNAVHLYQLARLERSARGATSLVERAADKYVSVSGQLLSRFGLEPRLSGTIASSVRVILYGAAAKGIESSIDRIEAGERYVSATIQNYRDLSRKYFPVNPAPVVPVDEGPSVVPTPSPPVDSPRPAPVPVAPPPVPTSPRGAPVIYVPSGRR